MSSDFDLTLIQIQGEKNSFARASPSSEALPWFQIRGEQNEFYDEEVNRKAILQTVQKWRSESLHFHLRDIRTRLMLQLIN